MPLGKPDLLPGGSFNSRASTSQRAYPGRKFVALILLLASTIFVLHIDRLAPKVLKDLLSREHCASKPASSVHDACRQVDPLFPRRTSPKLAELDNLFTSEQFKNLSIAHLSGAVKVRSESFDNLGPVGKDPRWDVFYNFAAYLKTTYPLTHSTLELEKVNTHGLLYTWKGSNPALRPTLLLAHQDTVPVT